jgi:hypothetical protein
VKEVYGVAHDGNSSSSSNNSHRLSIGLSPSKGQLPKARPCFVWRVDNNEVKILLCTTFRGDSPRDPKVLPDVPKDFLFNTLLLITSKNSTDLPLCFRSSNLSNFQCGTYVILVEYILPRDERELKKRDGGPLSVDQMLHINKLSIALQVEKVKADGEDYGKTILGLNLMPQNIIGSGGNDELKENANSETSSSIQTGRISHIENLNKHMFIEEWLNTCKNKIIRKKILINISYSNGR